MGQKRKAGQRVSKSNVQRKLCSARLNPVTSFIRTALPAGILFGLHIGVAVAGPEGGVVAAGQANISTPNATTTVVNQASQNAVVNWESFNVKTNEAVNFNQPNAQAQILNRIYDQNPSQILGSINANGKVLLINPNGVFFNATARVSVGSLIASGLDISDSDFMSGKHHFINPNGTEGGLVVNKGLIQASTGGSVSLIGGAVRNEGTIIATAGQVNLIAGKKVTMDFDGDGLIQFAVDEEILQNVHDVDDAVSNTGTINADGGTVLLKGKAAKDVFTNVVNNSGIIGASKIQNEGGVIRLVASGTSNSLINTGTLDASSADSDGGKIEIYASDTAIISEDALITAASSSEKGGYIEITGDKVGLVNTATVDASGETGGGEVLIGGDYQGKNENVQNASFTYIGRDTSIKANSSSEGDGGKVIVWANSTTRYFGDITAKAGSESGDGGFVEVSGKQHLAFDGTVNVSASNGYAGTVLLDPQDLTIVASGGANNGEVGAADGTVLFADPALGTDITIDSSAIEAITGNIDLQADRDLIINDPLNLANQTGGETVSFRAGNDLSINFAVETDGATLSFTADDASSTNFNAGTGTLTIGAAVGDANTGAVTFNNDGSGGIALNNSVTSSSTIDFNTAVTLGVGDITVTGGDNISFTSITGPFDLALNTGGVGTITATGAVTNIGDGVGVAIFIDNATTGLVNFQGVLSANSGIEAGADTSVQINGDVSLADGDTATDLAGNVTLDGLNWSSFDGITFGALTLSNGAVSLSSNGGDIDVTTINGGSQDLTIAAGTAAGTTRVTGAVSGLGDTLGAALTVANGVTGLVRFDSTVSGNSGIFADSGTSVRFDDNVTLTNGDTASSFETLQLDGMNWFSHDGLTVSGTTTMSGGPVSLNSNGGAISLNALTGGSQNLTIAAGTGAGTTTVSGAVSGLGSGTGASLTIANGVTGLVRFNGFVGGTSGIFADTGTSVRFDDSVNLNSGDTASSFETLQLDGMNWFSHDGLTVTGTTTMSGGPISLNSNGGNISLVALDGGNQDLTIHGSTAAGTTTVSGALTNLGDGTGAALTVANGVTGLVRFQGTVDGGSGIFADTGTSVRFDDNVTLTDGDTATTLDTTQLDGLTWSSFDGVSFGATTLSTADLNITSNDGGITFSNTLNGAQNLSLTAGAGNIDFDGIVGGTTDLLDVSIVSAADVTADLAFEAESITQTTGSGTTTFTGAVLTTGTNGSAHGVDLTNAGTGIVFSSTLNTSSNEVILEANAITLPTTLTATGSTVTLTTATAGNTIGVEDSGQSLNFTDANLDAIATGTIVIGESTNTGGISIADDAAITQNKNLQFNSQGAIALVDNSLTTINNGTVTINGSGTNAVTIGVLAGIIADGAVSITSGSGNIATSGDIDTTDDNVTFASATTLGGNVDIDTGTGAGNILFSSTIDMATFDLALDGGATGNITVAGAITNGGDLTVRDGAVQSYQAMDLDVLNILDAQTSVTLGDTVTMANAATVAINSSGTIVQTGAIVTATTVDLDAVGTLAINNAIGTSGTVDIDSTATTTVGVNGDITAGGVVTFGAAKTGTLTTSGDIDTTDDNIVFTQAVTLGGNVDIDSGAGAGNLSFTTIDMATFDLALDGGATGNITVAGAITNGGDLTVRDGAVQSYQAMDLDVLNILDAQTSVTLGDTVTMANAATVAINSSGTIVQTGAIVTATTVDLDAVGTLAINNAIGTSGTVDIDSTATTTVGVNGDITAGGVVTFGAAKTGTLTTSGDIDTTDDNIVFTQAVTLGGNVDIDSGAGAGNVIFNNTLDGSSTYGQDLTITAGAGNVSFLGAVGTTTPSTTELGDISIVSAANLTIDGNTGGAPGQDEAATTDTFVADSLIATALTGVVDIGDRTDGQGGDMKLRGGGGVTVDVLDILTNTTSTLADSDGGAASILISSNITVASGNIRLRSTGFGPDITVDYVGLPGRAGTTNATIDTRTVQAAGSITTEVGTGGAKTRLLDDGDSTTNPSNGKNTIFNSGTSVNADGLTLGNDLNDSNFPQITSPIISLTYSSTIELGDDAIQAELGAADSQSFTDAQMDGLLAGGTDLIITVDAGNIILDRATQFITSGGAQDLSLTTTTSGYITDNSTGTAFSSAGTGTGPNLTLSAVGNIGTDNPAGGAFAGGNTDGTLTIDVGSVTVSASANVNITDTGVRGDTIYDITTGGAGNITVTQTTNDILLGAISTTGAASFTASVAAIDDATAGADGITDITAATVDLNSALGIGGTNAVELAATTITADNSTSGNVDIDNALAGAVTVTTLTTAGAGTILFQNAGAGGVSFGTVSTTTDGSAADGEDDIRLSSDGGDLTITTSVTADGLGDIIYDTTTSGDIELTGTSTAGALVTMNSVGDIDGAGLVTAPTVDLNAATGIGATTPLELAATTITADNSTSGNVDIDNAATADVTLTSLTTTGAGSDLLFDSTGNFALNITGAVTSSDDITITNTGNLNTDTITIGAAVSSSTAGTITISSLTRGDIAVNNTITTADGGTITLNSSDAITVGAFAVNSGAAGTMNLNVDTNNNVAAILDLGGGTLTAFNINLDGGANTATVERDTLIGQNQANTWTLAVGDDDGTLANASLSSTANFTDFHNLTGNANSDLFDFDGGSLSGNVDGQAGINTLDYASLAGPISVTFNAAGATGFNGAIASTSQIGGTTSDITALTGSAAAGSGAGGDTLTGINATGVWNVQAGNDTYVSTNTLTFSGVENLTGGTGGDTFLVTESHTGNLSTGNGTNKIELDSTTGAILTGNITGGTGADSIFFGNDDGTDDNNNNFTMTGDIDGGAGTDTLDFLDSSLVLTVNNVNTSIPDIDGIEGTITGAPNLLNEFNNINTLVGNSLGSIVGPNVETWWNVTDVDQGTFGTSFATIATNNFSNFSIAGGTAKDVFIFEYAPGGAPSPEVGQVTGGVDGGTGGNNILVGSTGGDIFTITNINNVTVDIGGVPAVSNLSTILTNITSIDSTAEGNVTDVTADTFNVNSIWGATGGATDGSIIAGNLNDTFNINQNVLGSLTGGDGNDNFTFTDTRTVGGTLTGGAGTDIINWNAYTAARTVVLTASVADGYSGTEASITGGFDTIDDIRGSTAATTNSLTAENTVNAWAITGVGAGTDTGSITETGVALAFQEFETLNGGSMVDTFTIADGANVSNTLDGNAGVDILDLSAYTTARSVVINATSTTNGFAGTEASITNGFSDISTINLPAGVGDTLQGANFANTFAINSGADLGTLTENLNVLSFTGVNNLTGGTNTDDFTIASGATLSGNIIGGASADSLTQTDGANGWDITGTGAGTVTDVGGTFAGIESVVGGTGVDTFDFSATATINVDGAAGNDIFNVDQDITGTVTGGANDDAFNVTVASTANLLGGTGNDTFDIAATLTGSIDGEADVDVLQGTLITDVVLTGSDADGFAGTEADITLNFDGIQMITGNGAGTTLTGRNLASTWALDGTPTYNDGTNTLNFMSFATLQGGTLVDVFNVTMASSFNLNGGADADIFNFTAGALTGAVDGEAGDDAFNLSGGTVTGAVAGGANTDTLTGGNDYDVTGGNLGTVTGITAGWNTIENLTGTAGVDTFTFSGGGSLSGTATGLDSADTFDFNGGTVANVDGDVGADVLDFAGAGAVTVTLTGVNNPNGFAGTEGTHITTGFADVTTIIGNIGNDTLVGQNAAAVFNVTAANDTYISGGVTLILQNFDDFTGGTGVDIFNLTGNHAGNLTGGNGNDIVNLNVGALTGFVNGDAGNDTFNLNGGTVTGAITGGTNTDTLVGSSTGYTVTGANSGTHAQLGGGWNTVENLTGTGSADTFTFTGAGSISGTADGLGGADILDFSTSGSAQTVTVTALGATDGFNGTSTSSAGFSNIDTITTPVGNNTFTGGLAGTTNIKGGDDTYVSGGRTLILTGSTFANFNGSGGTDTINLTRALTGNINAGAGTNTVNIGGVLTGNLITGTGDDTVTTTAAVNGSITDTGGTNTINTTGGTVTGSISTGAGDDTITTVAVTGSITDTGGTNTVTVGGVVGGNLTTGAGDDTLNINSAITGNATAGAGSNILNSNASIGGTYTASGSDTWNHIANVRLATAVVGTGSLTIPDAAGGTLEIGAGDLLLPNLTGFTGHTVIGGTLTPAGIDPYYTATDITVNTVSLTVTDAIISDGSVTLLAGDIFLNNDITLTNGIIGMIAAGPTAVPGATTGVIDASAGPVTLTAPASVTNPSGAFVANDTIVSSQNITLDFGGSGEIDVAVGADDEIEFNGASQNIDTTTDPDFTSFVTNVLAAKGIAANVTTTFSINPASALIGLETLAFIDVGLFEEELTLYGQIGTGIALALAQCEEQEGCAPNVTEDELNNLINSLEARLLELERRLTEETDINVRAELEELIEGYNEEIKDFRGYRQQLQDFFSAEDEGFEEELDEDLPDEGGSLDEQPDADEVARLAKVLETVNARIEWLESLKANPDERARLSESTKIDLTQEVLDTIIEAARSEAAFIENQIKLLIEGTEAMLSPAPVFTAEARDYDSIQTVHYGSNFVDFDGLSAKSLLNIN